MFFTKCSIPIGLALIFLVHASAQQSQKSAGRSVIHGRVIYADTGRPLRRAEVTLFIQETETWVASSITDRNGEFDINNVSAGRYFLLVKAPDIVSPLDEVATGGSLNLGIALGKFEDGFSEVTVDGRSPVKTEIRASRGGVITGRVMTEADEPIAGAQIKLYQVQNGKLRPAAATSRLLDHDKKMLETDSRGIYRIAGLAAGEYIVRASESDEGGSPDDAQEGSYTDGSMMVAFYPKAVRVQDAGSVKVEQGSETKDVDIRFTERIGHRVSGTVLRRGKPVSDAEIRLSGDEPEEIYRDDSVQARSDDNGHWEIRTVPDGKYKLTISGFMIGMVRLDEGREFVQVAPLQRELVVEGSDITNLTLEVVEAGTIRGVVSVEGGTPVPGRFGVKLLRSNSSLNTDTDDAVSSTLIDPKGAFSLIQIPPGSFYLGFTDLRGSHYVKSVTLKGKDLLRNPVKIEAGQVISGVSVVLSADLISVSGRTVEKSDRSKPVPNATVLLFPVEAERRRTSDGPIIAVSDKDGRFVVKGAPGEYFVFVIDRTRKDIPVVMPTEADLVKNATTLQKINLQRGDEKKVVEVVGP